MKVKTYNLIEATLDWAVAKCEGFVLPDMTHSLYDWFKAYGPRYSTDWALGGPLKEREKIETRWIITDSEGGGYWQAANLFTDTYGYTHRKSELAAAMRCYVASKLGDVVDIPDELA